VTRATEHAARRLVDRCFEGRLPPGDWDDLFVHLRGCPPCREHFERARLAFRALGGANQTAPALGRAEADLIRDALLPAPSRAPRRLAWAGAVTVLAAGLATTIFLTLPARPPGTFVERGAETPRHAFDVLCIPAQQERATVSAAAARGRCAPGSFLKAVVTRPDPGRPNVVIIALDPAWTMRSTVRTEALGEAPVVAPGHLQLGDSESLVFFALFSREAIGDADLQRAVESARRRGGKVEELHELPLAGVAQLRLAVRAAEARDGR
jgi:hypothetical protein